MEDGGKLAEGCEVGSFDVGKGLAGVGCCSAAIRSETAAAAASREEVAGRGVWMGCQVMVSMMRTALVSVA